MHTDACAQMQHTYLCAHGHSFNTRGQHFFSHPDPFLLLLSCWDQDFIQADLGALLFLWVTFFMEGWWQELLGCVAMGLRYPFGKD